jgi:PAS domain S-box-containing protein
MTDPHARWLTRVAACVAAISGMTIPLLGGMVLLSVWKGEANALLVIGMGLTLIGNGVVCGAAITLVRAIPLYADVQKRTVDASVRRYQDLLDSLSDIVYVNTPLGEIADLNPAFERILGYATADWIGKSPADLIHPDDIPRGAAVIAATARGGQPPPFEVRVKRSDGAYIWLEFRSVPLYDAHGAVVAVTGVARDLSAQKAAEAARLKRALERERQAIIRQFVESFAHYFRNALASINTGIDLSRRVLPPESRAHVSERFTRITQSIRDMGEQLDNLNIVSSLALEQPTKVSVTMIAEQIVPALALRALQKEVRLFWMIQSDTPILPVRAHLQALTEAIRSLLINALHATPPDGDVSLYVRMDSENVYIVVRDSGGGMTSDQLTRAFDPFYRLDSERGIDSGGIGLGLTIVRMVAEACGGEVRVESSPGAGSTFTLVLPIARE